MFPDVSLPESVQALVLMILFFTPGFVAGKVFDLCFRRTPVAERLQLVEYVTLSCINYALWSWLILLVMKGRLWETHPWAFLLGVVVVLLGSPFLLGFTLAVATEKQWFAILAAHYGVRPPHHIAAAWDWFFRKHSENRWWVIVRLRNGIILRGFFGWQSFAGSDPERRDLYLEAVCDVDDRGRFRVIQGTGGIYLKDADIVAIEFRTVEEVKDKPDHFGKLFEKLEAGELTILEEEDLDEERESNEHGED